MQHTLSVVARTIRGEPCAEDMLLCVVESEREVHITAAFQQHLPYPEKITRIMQALEERGKPGPSPEAKAKS
jgi:hypothetical protein